MALPNLIQSFFSNAPASTTGGNPAPAPATTTGTPGTGEPSSPGTGAPAGTPEPKPAANPLDAYSKMFDNSTNPGDAAPEFRLDPEKLNSVVSGMSFTEAIPQELKAKMLTGDAGAFMEALDYVGRQAYSNAIQHQSHLTGKFLDTRLGFEQKNISNTVRKQMTNTELSSSPNFDHPVVRNQLNSIADSLALANPDWHPKQVADAAKQYITDLAGALNPNAGKDTENKDTPKQMDWSKYLS